jgi:hypothetical protein
MYESSSDSDPNDESTNHQENLFYDPHPPSTNFDNINGSAAKASNVVADRVRKVSDFMKLIGSYADVLCSFYQT